MKRRVLVGRRYGIVVALLSACVMLPTAKQYVKEQNKKTIYTGQKPGVSTHWNKNCTGITLSVGSDRCRIRRRGSPLGSVTITSRDKQYSLVISFRILDVDQKNIVTIMLLFTTNNRCVVAALKTQDHLFNSKLILQFGSLFVSAIICYF